MIYLLLSLAVSLPSAVFGIVRTAKTRYFDPNAASSQYFGTVAVDGQNLAVGSWSSEYIGFVRFFHQDSNLDWSFTNDVYPSDGSFGDDFGVWIAMSGMTAVVSASRTSVQGLYPNGGQVYAIDMGGDGSWSEAQIINLGASSSSGGQFGFSSGIDGNLMAVACPFCDVQWANQGTVAMYRRIGSGWDLMSFLLAPNPDAYNQFGFSLDVEKDLIVACAIYYIEGDGACFVYEKSGHDFSLIDTLTNSFLTNGANFGYSVSIDPNNDRILVGSNQWYDQVFGTSRGSAFIFDRFDNDWIMMKQFWEEETASGDEYGTYVLVKGEYAYVSSAFVNSTGAVYIYHYGSGAGGDAGQWTFEERLGPTDGSDGQYFGWMMDVTDDDHQLFVTHGGSPIGYYQNDMGILYMYEQICAAGFMEVVLSSGDLVCYDVSVNKVYYDDGLAICMEMAATSSFGGYLGQFSSSANLDHVREALTDSGELDPSEKAWVGGQSDIRGNNVEAADYTWRGGPMNGQAVKPGLWQNGEPSGNGKCVQFDNTGSGGGLDDQSCTSRRRVVCEHEVDWATEDVLVPNLGYPGDDGGV